MKTVQEWLNEVDEDALIDTYIKEFDVMKYELCPSMRVEAVASSRIKTFRHYLHRVKEMQTVDHRDEWVFFASPRPEVDYIDIPFVHLNPRVRLCYLESILGEDEPEFDTWVTALPEDVFGCAIAETRYTVNNMYTVLSWIIWDNTFFGYEEDSVANFVEELDRDIDNEQWTEPLTSEELSETLDEAIEESEGDSKTYFDLSIPVLKHGKPYNSPEKSGESYKEKMRALAVDYDKYLLNNEIAEVRKVIHRSR